MSPRWDPVRALDADEAATRQRLDELVGDYAGIVEASEGSNADDEHDPEGATIAFERSQVRALVQQAEAHLGEIDAAVQRLDDGTYGVCTTCGAMIPEGRLEVRPTAATCVTCAASQAGSRRS